MTDEEAAANRAMVASVELFWPQGLEQALRAGADPNHKVENLSILLFLLSKGGLSARHATQGNPTPRFDEQNEWSHHDYLSHTVPSQTHTIHSSQEMKSRKPEDRPFFACVRLLLEAKADCSPRPEAQWVRQQSVASPLHAVLTNARANELRSLTSHEEVLEVLHLLIDYGSPLMPWSQLVLPPLLFFEKEWACEVFWPPQAATSFAADILEVLVSRGANPNQPDSLCHNAAHSAPLRATPNLVFFEDSTDHLFREPHDPTGPQPQVKEPDQHDDDPNRGMGEQQRGEQQRGEQQRGEQQRGEQQRGEQQMGKRQVDQKDMDERQDRDEEQVRRISDPLSVSFPYDLQPGDNVDLCDTTNCWMVAKILQVLPEKDKKAFRAQENTEPRASVFPSVNDELRMSYYAWSTWWDEWVQRGSLRIRPCHTVSLPCRMINRLAGVGPSYKQRLLHRRHCQPIPAVISMILTHMERGEARFAKTKADNLQKLTESGILLPVLLPIVVSFLFPG